MSTRPLHFRDRSSLETEVTKGKSPQRPPCPLIAAAKNPQPVVRRQPLRKTERGSWPRFLSSVATKAVTEPYGSCRQDGWRNGDAQRSSRNYYGACVKSTRYVCAFSSFTRRRRGWGPACSLGARPAREKHCRSWFTNVKFLNSRCIAELVCQIVIRSRRHFVVVSTPLFDKRQIPIPQILLRSAASAPCPSRHVEFASGSP